MNLRDVSLGHKWDFMALYHITSHYLNTTKEERRYIYVKLVTVKKRLVRDSYVFSNKTHANAQNPCYALKTQPFSLLYNTILMFRRIIDYSSKLGNSTIIVFFSFLRQGHLTIFKDETVHTSRA